MRELLVADFYIKWDCSRVSSSLAGPAVSENTAGIAGRFGMLSPRQTFNDLSTSLLIVQSSVAEKVVLPEQLLVLKS